uniref:Methyltransferase type 11 n=1 Tax=Cyanothece sp. (strain PCC 7425 / ATCC 29141) TaxID=395961 RepID=B8HLZ8_CYAP4
MTETHPATANFFSTILQSLIRQDPLGWYKDEKWYQEAVLIQNSEFSYPAYYTAHHFHNVTDGYLSVVAALSYDLVSPLLLLPGEQVVRQELLQSIAHSPTRILDLGCGTGTATLMLKQAVPRAEVTGLDLSPYMLSRAIHKTRAAGLEVEFVQGNAECTHFATESFDLVVASFLLHETPALVSQAILRECHRLLSVGGRLVILDGHQHNLRGLTRWDHLFGEPYLQDYSWNSTNAWMEAAGLTGVKTEPIWWLYQLSHGLKQS